MEIKGNFIDWNRKKLEVHIKVSTRTFKRSLHFDESDSIRYPSDIALTDGRGIYKSLSGFLQKPIEQTLPENWQSRQNFVTIHSHTVRRICTFPPYRPWKSNPEEDWLESFGLNRRIRIWFSLNFLFKLELIDSNLDLKYSKISEDPKSRLLTNGIFWEDRNRLFYP